MIMQTAQVHCGTTDEANSQFASSNMAEGRNPTDGKLLIFVILGLLGGIGI